MWIYLKHFFHFSCSTNWLFEGSVKILFLHLLECVGMHVHMCIYRFVWVFKLLYFTKAFNKYEFIELKYYSTVNAHIVAVVLLVNILPVKVVKLKYIWEERFSTLKKFGFTFNYTACLHILVIFKCQSEWLKSLPKPETNSSYHVFTYLVIAIL